MGMFKAAEDARLAYWAEHVEALRKLLEELNQDRYNGRCTIIENIDDTFRARRITKPNIGFRINNVCYVTISMAGNEGFVVLLNGHHRWRGTGHEQAAYTLEEVADTLIYIVSLGTTVD